MRPPPQAPSPIPIPSCGHSGWTVRGPAARAGAVTAPSVSPGAGRAGLGEWGAHPAWPPAYVSRWVWVSVRVRSSERTNDTHPLAVPPPPGGGRGARAAGGGGRRGAGAEVRGHRTPGRGASRPRLQVSRQDRGDAKDRRLRGRSAPPRPPGGWARGRGSPPGPWGARPRARSAGPDSLRPPPRRP